MPNVHWISHRGHCYDGIENTLNAFNCAKALGFTEFETDLRCSKDGHVVLCHDPNLSCLSQHPLAQQPIHHLTLEQLKAISLNDGQNILTLKELLNEFIQQRWIFDIKPETAEKTLSVLSVLRQKNEYNHFLTKQVRYLFWQADHEKTLLENHPHSACMAPLGACRRAGFACIAGLPFLGAIQADKTYALPPTFKGINLYRKNIISYYHSRQARVLAYLPKSDSQVELATAAGVNEILTDFSPDRLQ